jgi:hypothetical protein
MLRTTTVAVTGILVMGTSAAYAASGSLTDPKGDYPDIVKLAYSNAKTKVTMTMTFAGGHGQNESFYLRWGAKGASYQVFSSPSAGLKELRYAASKAAVGKRVTCKALVVKQLSSTVTTVSIPRSCIVKAPDALRFQGIATEGLSLHDDTKLSPAVKRG